MCHLISAGELASGWHQTLTAAHSPYPSARAAIVAAKAAALAAALALPPLLGGVHRTVWPPASDMAAVDGDCKLADLATQ